MNNRENLTFIAVRIRENASALNALVKNLYSASCAMYRQRYFAGGYIFRGFRVFNQRKQRKTNLSAGTQSVPITAIEAALSVPFSARGESVKAYLGRHAALDIRSLDDVPGQVHIVLKSFAME